MTHVYAQSLSRVRLFATPWTVAYQAPPSMGFSKQEYWSGLPFPSPIIIKIFKNKTNYYKLGQIKSDESFLKEYIYLSVLKG